MKFIKKPVVVEATQWFKNGDHPLDYTTDAPVIVVGVQQVVTAHHRRGNNWEGEVVRYYRTPERYGEVQCQHCGKTMHVHGWIDTLEGGHIVCPGDWVITVVKGERTLRLPGARLEGLDAVAVGAENLAGMSFDLVSSRPNGFGGAEVDHLTVHVVNVEGNGILAVSANDTSACELVRRDPVLHLTDAGSRLGVHLIAIAGVTQTVPAPGCTLGAGGLWSRWSRPALTDSGAEPCVASSCLEPGATLGADEVVSHAGIVIPYLYTCKPDVFAATYEPADTEAPGTKSLASEGAAAALSDEACEKIAHQARRGDMAQRRVEELERELASLHESRRKIDADAGGCALSCDGTGCNTMSELAISKARASELEDLLPGAAWLIRRCLSIYPAERRPLAEYMARQIEAAMRGEGSIGASPLLAKIEAQDAEIKQLKEKIDLLGTAGTEWDNDCANAQNKTKDLAVTLRWIVGDGPSALERVAGFSVVRGHYLKVGRAALAWLDKNSSAATQTTNQNKDNQ